MIIALANQKGGVSKTTTAAALASGLHGSGKKVLAIDADPQCSLSFVLGADTAGRGLLDLLQGQATFEEVVQNTEQADIIPGSKRLAAAQAKIRPATLREILARNGKRYQHIIIDTGPGLQNALIFSLLAADLVIIPAIADAGSLMGLRDLAETIRATRTAEPVKMGVLITQANTRKTNAEKAIEEALRTTCKELRVPLFKTQIRRADAVRAAAGFRESIITYDPKSKPAADYMALLHELKLI